MWCTVCKFEHELIQFLGMQRISSHFCKLSPLWALVSAYDLPVSCLWYPKENVQAFRIPNHKVLCVRKYWQGMTTCSALIQSSYCKTGGISYSPCNDTASRFLTWFSKHPASKCQGWHSCCNNFSVLSSMSIAIGKFVDVKPQKVNHVKEKHYSSLENSQCKENPFSRSLDQRNFSEIDGVENKSVDNRMLSALARIPMLISRILKVLKVQSNQGCKSGGHTQLLEVLYLWMLLASIAAHHWLLQAELRWEFHSSLILIWNLSLVIKCAPKYLIQKIDGVVMFGLFNQVGRHKYENSTWEASKNMDVESFMDLEIPQICGLNTLLIIHLWNGKIALLSSTDDPFLYH